MAISIVKIFQKNLGTKMLVIFGNLHILRKLGWQDQVRNPHMSIRQYVKDFNPNLRMFSIGQIIGDSVYECDFREKFDDFDGEYGTQNRRNR